ncbi:glycosyl hydrolase family 71-domain-containing protein [Dipodascopsis uninucleata]
MTIKYIILLLLLNLYYCHGLHNVKYVFAHYILGNTAGFTVDEFIEDMRAAQRAHIDAFVLDIAPNDINNAKSLSNFFKAAAEVGFKGFFSFDYNSDGIWSVSEVVDLISQYSGNTAYFHYLGRPLVSTFEGGPEESNWTCIKEKIKEIFFIPEWSDQGPAVATNNVADGALSWDAWPTGPTTMNTSNDKAYMTALGSKPYIMPVSPWFYSIISWNDYGESHYIGPLHSNEGLVAEYGGAPFDYAADMPHDGWRSILPYLIERYKMGVPPTITSDIVVVWYRKTPIVECNANGTVCNNPSYQEPFLPQECLQDKIFFQALLGSRATVNVSIGNFSKVFDVRKRGLYFNSLPFQGYFGEVEVSVWYGNLAGPKVSGPIISPSCENREFGNFNVWVGSSESSLSNSLTTLVGSITTSLLSPIATSTHSLRFPMVALLHDAFYEILYQILSNH